MLNAGGSTTERSAHQNLHEIKRPFELVADYTLQCLYSVRFQQMSHLHRGFGEHFLPYLRGGIILQHGDCKRLSGDIYSGETNGKICGTEDSLNNVS